MSEALSSSTGTPTGREPVIVGGARTAIGRLLGSLAGFSGAGLGGMAIKAALERSGIGGDQVDYVIMGQVLQAGAGQIPARQAAVAAGVPMSVPAMTLNKVCLSGLDAIALAAQYIRLGEFDVVVAGGMESMTQAPHLLPKSRSGYKYGPVEVQDSMALDGLTDAYDHVSMGESTERLGAKLGISRAEQDEFSALSHQRAAAAVKNGVLAEEIAGVSVPRRGGDPLLFDEDEGIRPETTAESLSRLRPAFAQDGTITAGSASQISDGAAAVVVMARETAAALGTQVLAEVGPAGLVAGQERADSGRPGPDRDQRGLRHGRHPVHARPGCRPGAGQRQRRRDRAGPPDRGVRHPDRPAPGLRTAPPRRRGRRGRALRRRRPGRGAAAARAGSGGLTTARAIARGKYCSRRPRRPGRRFRGAGGAGPRR
jgi:acetyl-CoA C-acetyltransferase